MYTGTRTWCDDRVSKLAGWHVQRRKRVRMIRATCSMHHAFIIAPAACLDLSGFPCHNTGSSLLSPHHQHLIAMWAEYTWIVVCGALLAVFVAFGIGTPPWIHHHAVAWMTIKPPPPTLSTIYLPPRLSPQKLILP